MSNSIPSKLRLTAIVLLILVGLNAAVAGFSFITEPSSEEVGIPVTYLRFSPFSDFLIPGILLFIFIGVFSLLIAYASVQRWGGYPLLMAFQGIVLIVWIFVQVILVQDFNLMQFLCLVVGIIIFFCGWILKRVSEN